MPLTHPLDIIPPIPIGKAHPGSFGVDRHKHVHTGVDLYTAHGTPVKSMEDGIVISIEWFTGSSIGMPWWNDTRAVYIEGSRGVFCYGEIQEAPGLEVGKKVSQGQYIGHVLTVLRRYKGRPMSMLHLELYDHGYKDDWREWKIGDPKPEHLKDPTPYLIAADLCKTIHEDPYKESHSIFGGYQCPHTHTFTREIKCCKDCGQQDI